MFKPGSFVFIVLLGMIFATGTLGNDLFAPAQPFIIEDFNTTSFKAQLIFPAYLVGLAIAQITFGPLSDRFGRRPVLRSGLWLFAFLTLACAFSPTIEVLIALRFLQGFAASSGLVIARAIARDHFEGPKLGEIMSYMSLTLSLSPVLLPPLGGVLSASFGWEATFLFLAVLALLVALATDFGIRESIQKANLQIWTLRELGINLGKIFKNRTFIGYMATGSLCFAGLFAFISNSSFVGKDFLDIPMDEFGLYMGLAFAGHSLGIFVGGQIVTRLGGATVITLGTLICAISGITLVILNFTATFSVLSFFILITFYLFGTGFVYPHSLAGALHPFPDMAGTASATMGFCVMMTSGLTSAIVGAYYTGTPTAMVTFIGLVGTLAFILFRVFRRANALEENF